MVMNYLKNSKCGHLNVVKTQYLAFCTGCNKKPDNTFTYWQVLQPDGAFGDYVQQVCLTEEQVKAVPLPVKGELKKGKLVKYLQAGVLAITLIYAVDPDAGSAVFKHISSKGTAAISAAILEQKWSQETYGNYGLSLEAPVKLIRSKIPLSANIRDAIDHMDVFSYQSLKGFNIMVSCIRYKPLVDSLSLQGAANGSVNEARLQSGITDFNYTQQPHHAGDIPGFLQKGTFRKDMKTIEFQNAGFVKGLNLWQVWVAYSAYDETGRKMADRIIASIKINYAGQ